MDVWPPASLLETLNPRTEWMTHSMAFRSARALVPGLAVLTLALAPAAASADGGVVTPAGITHVAQPVDALGAPAAVPTAGRLGLRITWRDPNERRQSTAQLIQAQIGDDED